MNRGDELARVRSDKRFIAWAIAKYCLLRKTNRARVLTRLGMDETSVGALELRLRPDDLSDRSIRRLSRECEVRGALFLGGLLRAVAASEADAPPADVADALGITPRRVYQLRGVRSRKPRVTEKDREQIRAMLDKGLSRRSIVKATGKSRKVVDAVARG